MAKLAENRAFGLCRQSDCSFGHGIAPISEGSARNFSRTLHRRAAHAKCGFNRSPLSGQIVKLGYGRSAF